MNLRRPNLSDLRLRSPRGAGSKRPDVPVPDFVRDVYYDLRDRRLLPLVALVLVAIAAVPFLLGADAEEPPVPPPPAAAGGAPAGGAAEGKLTVVQSKPGLRDYQKRLKSLTPTDPFEQRYTSVPQSAQLKSVDGGEGGGSGAGAGGGEGGSAGSPETAPPSGSGGGSGGSGGGSGGTPEGGSGGKLRLIAFVFDVQISRSRKTADGKQEMTKPKVRRKVRSLTQLPGKKAPVVTAGGVNLRNGKVYFLISDKAHSLDGDFTCVTRTPGELCELLEVEPGFPFDVLYGENKVRFRFKVTKIDAEWAGQVGDKRSSRAHDAEFGIQPGIAFGGRSGIAR